MSKRGEVVIGLVAFTGFCMAAYALHRVTFEIGLTEELMTKLENLNTELVFARMVEHMDDKGPDIPGEE